MTVEGVRYQVPAPWRHLRQLDLRVTRWDFSSVDMVDLRNDERLAVLFPVDKHRNADGVRRHTGARDETTQPVSVFTLTDGAAIALFDGH